MPVVDVWTMETNEVFTLRCPAPYFAEKLAHLQYSPSNEAILLAAFVDGYLMLWNVESRCRLSGCYVGCTFDSRCPLKLRPHSNEVVVGCSSGSILVWEYFLTDPCESDISVTARQGTPQPKDWIVRKETQVHTDSILSICLSSDGNSLVSGADNAEVC
jgi:WD40 repeat protein